ncbi:hypothetical protein CVT26_002312 [Gymnopilus dilepis]|uniref:Rpr2-domain-containing protein n=1 Tax=Gymnopilus dilepis TaxID=231916 RepID=A0A409Y3F4_9AGAR|nr:hypothetical protein CVT26_002312 [Gymnopilus dilepis]
MVKKQKDDTPNVNSTANRDVVQRLNFLYQAGVYLQSAAPTLSAEEKGKARQTDLITDQMEDISSKKERDDQDTEMASVQKKKQRRKINMKDTGDLARTYVESMRVVGQKATVKMDPSLKRSLCSGCSTVLIPGSTATVRVKKSRVHGHIMAYTCMHCRTTKRIPSPPIKTPIFDVPVPTAGIAQPVDHPQQLPLTTDTKMETTTIPSEAEAPSAIKPSHPRKRKRKAPPPRPPPLFARPDAGHVLFRGNQRLELGEERGSGSCFG